jgi:hypothetical protein
MPDEYYRAVLLMNAIRKAVGQAIAEGKVNVSDEIKAAYARVLELEADELVVREAAKLDPRALDVPTGFDVAPEQAVDMIIAAREKDYDRWHTQLDKHFGGANRPGQPGQEARGHDCV